MKRFIALCSIIFAISTSTFGTYANSIRINPSGIENNINYDSGEYEKYTINSLEDLNQFYKDAVYARKAKLEITVSSIEELEVEDLTQHIVGEQSIVAGVDVTEQMVSIENNVISLRIAYATTTSEREEVTKFVKQWVSENIRSDMSDYEKIVKIYQQVASYRYYSTDPNDLSAKYPKRFEPYSLIKYGKGVCHASAGLIKLMADECGLEVIDILGNVHSSLGSEYNVLHIWNMIKLDGKWYHLDSSWDSVYFSTTKYFLKSDIYMRTVGSRTWDASLYPEATEAYDKK